MLTFVTDICQSIDLYNNIEKTGYKSLRVKYRQIKLYKNIKKIIKKTIIETPLNSDTLKDFFQNYMATIDIISLDNCSCIYNEVQREYIFTVKNENGAVSFAVNRFFDPFIDVSICQNSEHNSKNFRFIGVLRDVENENENKTLIGLKCEILLEDCIKKYLEMRLDLHKIQQEEQNAKEESNNGKHGAE